LRSLLKAAVQGQKADYVEVRVEESFVTSIEFRGPRLESVSQSVEFGGNVRALVRGGWGFVSFNSLDELEDRVKAAIKQAALIARTVDRPLRLAPVPTVEDTVRVKILRDPRQVPLSQKIDLMAGYNERILSHPGISSSQVRYFDRFTKLYYANSEGTYIEQERLDLAGSLAALAKGANTMERGSFSFGSSNDFGVAEGHEKEIDRICRLAVDLTRAPVVKGGEYTVICDPRLAGVFVHEAFGHLSEADHVYENENLRRIMKLGTVFGTKILNIYDSGLDVGARGYLVYDDEGVRTEKTYLIKEGRLVGRLHSRETAARMGERPTGNARALDYRFKPICRMRNTCIEPGDATLEDMLAGVREGIYAANFYGGETNGEMFTFTAGEAYMIRNGRIEELVRNATLTGNVFQTLKNIDMIGRDFTRFDSAGGCGKAGQAPLPTSEWSPHIRIQNVVIGGRG